jgi:hypothetical protein
MRTFLFLPDRNYHVLPPLTDELVKDAERKLGVKLPQSYLDVLKIQNGGSLRYDTYPTPVPTSYADDHVSVDYLMGIGNSDEGIEDSPYYIGEWGLPEELVLLCGDGHWWVALDYRQCGPEGEPSVVYVDVECDPIEDVQLAPTFSVFLDGLVKGSHQHVFGFVGEEDVQVLIKNLEAALGCSFQPSKRLNLYYDAKHPVLLDSDGRDQERLSVRPNLNSSGHLEYPWYPECHWLLSCDIRKKDKAAFEECLRGYLPANVVVIHIPPWGE